MKSLTCKVGRFGFAVTIANLDKLAAPDARVSHAEAHSARRSDSGTKNRGRKGGSK